MAKLEEIVAAHPLRTKPYHCIRFVRLGPHGSPLYRVTGDTRDLGAREALKAAFEIHGGHCFHCKEWHEPQKLCDKCSRDHVRPRSGGGGDYLHNLVITCWACNKRKGSRDLVEFRAARGSDYLKALDEHLARCIEELKNPSPSSPPPPRPAEAAGP